MILQPASIFDPRLRKVKTNIWKKEKKNAFFYQPRTEKQIMQVSNIHIFFFYFLLSRMPGLVKLSTENGFGLVKWFWGE